MVDHSAYDPTNTKVSTTYCPACERVVACGTYKYMGMFSYARHYADPHPLVKDRERCMNSGWPVHAAFFIRDDNRFVTREQYERGRAPGDSEVA